MTATNPLSAIKNWIEEQDSEIARDIGFSMSLMLIDKDIDLNSDHPIELLNWLHADASYRTVGKALSFVAAFEHFYGKRFTDAGWQETARFFESVLEDNEADESIKASTRTMIADIPARAERWKKIGESWSTLKNTHLSSSAIRSFEADAMINRRSALHFKAD